ncbi:MAG: hypothetical protein L3K26_17555 [Candidatus Hydrogenedentes bacterium]|nr:hypothetical protein [Candidatus Hydrogenedentota bacterium]
MNVFSSFRVLLQAAMVLALSSNGAWAVWEDLGSGYVHHGVATPVSNHRGTVATVDGEGRNVVLVWLFDHRGGYALLMIDAATGKSEEYPMPFPPGGDTSYTSILSSQNKFYTHFNSHFVEFDPVKRAFTFFQKTHNQMAMGMTEDDDGSIWAVTYPNSGVVAFDPKSSVLTDYGHVYAQNWRQYQRYVATDDSGWLYFGIGSTAAQLIAFDPETRKATPIVPDADRVKGAGYVYRDLNGKVYGHGGNNDMWYELYQGKATPIDKPATQNPKPIITSSQGLFYREFPDGKRLKTWDTVERVIEVEDPATGKITKNSFDYKSEGAHIMGIATAPNGTLCGGTAFPMRFFSYDPSKDTWVNRAAYGQCNTVVRQGDHFFVGGYGGGFLLDWQPEKEWVATTKTKASSNPRFLTQCTPTIHRPHDLLAHPDGKTLVLAGTPGYGYTGGGLLFWDRETETRVLIEHTDILPEHSTMSLVALPKGRILGGSTIGAGTGGEEKAKEAELYIMDMATKKLEWHDTVFPGIRSYTDLYCDEGGLVYGVANQHRFFVFDPESKKVVHEIDTTDSFGSTISHQGPRVFVAGPDGALFMLFRKGVARVDLSTHAITMIAESPVSIGPGGAYHDGRIYFGSGSHLYSFDVSAKSN